MWRRSPVRPILVTWPHILRGLFVELGEVARAHDTGAFLTVDELHYVGATTMTALIVGLHRASQLALPITIAERDCPLL